MPSQLDSMAAALPSPPKTPTSQSMAGNDPHRSPPRNRASGPQPDRRSALNDYGRLVRDIRTVVKSTVPAGATVAVISKGDSQLLNFKGRTGWHFPQAADGSYSGYHPADSAAALAELEKLRAKGADYLLLPNTAFWWLEYYQDFVRHLETRYQTVWNNHHCRIYRISDRQHAAGARAGLRALVAPALTRAVLGREAVRPENLCVAIDSRIPEKLVVGAGNAFYIAGWCYHPSARVTKLEVVVNGWAHALKTWGAPRPDVKAAHYPHQDRAGRSYHSGFWGFVPIRKLDFPQEAQISIRATLPRGKTAERVVAHVRLEPGPGIKQVKQLTNGSSPLVAICMASYNPPLELFKRQIESIRNQTLSNWICIIADDGSRPDIFEKAHRIIGDDRRFRIHRTQTGVGFYSNFERCLTQVPESVDFIALSDHDDYWHPDKLECLAKAFETDTSLVYSDMRIVEENGSEISPTYWTTRPNNFSRFGSLLMANTITGGALMFRRSLLGLILPFPQRIGEAYHDHWIGAVALAAGTIKYVDRPLYDYIQHASNVIGHYAPAKPMPLLHAGSTFQRPGEMLRETLKYWERVDMADLTRIQLMTEVLQLRCGDRMSPGKAAELRLIDRLGRSWRSLFWLARRAMSDVGKITETIGAERPLLGAALWRHSIRSRLVQKAGGPNRHAPQVASSAPAALQTHSSVEVVREKIAPLSLTIAPQAPRRLNLLIPTIDLKYFFGGYITKFNLARRLAEEGVKVRMVIVDHCDWQPSHWQQQLKKFEGLEKFFDLVEVAYAYDRSEGLEVNPDDAFMATTWWTAHIAHRAMRALGRSHFLYLVQEYEPFTFAMGSFAALANQSYEFPHYAIFSTEMLRTYFRENHLGVFAGSEADGLAKSVSFKNAITEVGQITREDLANRLNKRLLYYARPEAHAARNMFELGLLALGEAVDEGYFDKSWEFYGIGSVGPAQRLALPQGRHLTILPRENQHTYRDILRAHDLGLALMYTPHPNLVPLEMASAGMVVVTTAYANKTQDVLGQVSPNLIAAHPSIEQIKLALRQASERVYDYDSRVAGARVNWPTNWESAFNSELLATLDEFIKATRAAMLEA